jgi:hypothetical protein
MSSIFQNNTWKIKYISQKPKIHSANQCDTWLSQSSIPFTHFIRNFPFRYKFIFVLEMLYKINFLYAFSERNMVGDAHITLFL